MEDIIVLVSGGIDSFLMISILKEDYNIYPIYIDYNHLAGEQEKKAVKKQIEYLGLSNLIEISISNISKNMKNSLINMNEYENDFYPARNLLLLTIASQIAYSKNINRIAIGIIKGSRIFPDCTDEYISDAENLLSQSINKDISIFKPLSNFSKKDIITLFNEMNLPFNLVYSCQKGQKKHCGLCPSCIELFKELKGNGVRKNED